MAMESVSSWGVTISALARHARSMSSRLCIRGSMSARGRVAAARQVMLVAAGSTSLAGGMSCPVSSCRWLLILIEDPLQGAVVGRVVDGVVLPAAPDDVDPGAGQDTDGVLVVAFPGEGFGVEVGGPGVAVTGVAGEVAERVAEFLVGSPAEGHCFDLAGLPGRRGDSGKAGQRARGGEAPAGIADLGQQSGGPDAAGAGQR